MMENVSDVPEAEDLAVMAERRMQRADADPTDRQSAAAAQQLLALAQDVRGLAGSSLLAEYRAICGWLDEFDAAADFQQLAHAYCCEIGVTQLPADGQAYLWHLIELARQTAGAL